MTQDVEMKEQPALSSGAAVSAPSTSTLHHLKEIVALIETGAYSREVRRILRAIRLTMALRRALNASVVSSFLNFALSLSEDEHEMEVDSGVAVTQSSGKPPLPELEMYCYLLVLIFLIDLKKYSEAKACSFAGTARLKNLNRRTVDVLASKLYFYYSLSYELTDMDLLPWSSRQWKASTVLFLHMVLQAVGKHSPCMEINTRLALSLWQ